MVANFTAFTYTNDLFCRYIGTITGISDLDPVRWPNSHWRSVKVSKFILSHVALYRIYSEIFWELILLCNYMPVLLLFESFFFWQLYTCSSVDYAQGETYSWQSCVHIWWMHFFKTILIVLHILYCVLCFPHKTIRCLAVCLNAGCMTVLVGPLVELVNYVK